MRRVAVAIYATLRLTACYLVEIRCGARLALKEYAALVFTKELILKIRSLIALLAVLPTLIPFSCACLHAETLASVSDLKSGTRISSYLFSQEQMRELYNAGVFHDRQLGLQQGCKEPHRVKPTALEILTPIDLPEGRSHPAQGAWRHRFEFERCGATKTYNVIFVSNNGEHPRVQPYHPGATGASIQLVLDTLKSIVPAVRALAKEQGIEDCKELLVADMAMTQTPHDVVEDGKTLIGVWSEKWTILACGRPVDISLEFIPDGKGGTTYAIRNEP